MKGKVPFKGRWGLYIGLLAGLCGGLCGGVALRVTPGFASSSAVGSSHLGNLPASALFATGGFTVDPGQTFPALSVPQGMIFVLTDVIVYPVVESSNPEFVVRYRVEENTLVKFQYNTVGTAANWSQHFTGGIQIRSGSTVNVVNTSFSTGRTAFQLLGYFTTP